jgi:hypothetical protein
MKKRSSPQRSSPISEPDYTISRARQKKVAPSVKLRGDIGIKHPQGGFRPISDRYLFFGQYLHGKGLVTFEDIYKARMFQKRNNLKIGELAMKRGWLTAREIETILVIQEETLERFGEIAVRRGYLSNSQLAELLKNQKEEYLFFGEALIKLGLITESKLIESLKEFNRVKMNHAPHAPTKAL